MNGMGTYQQSMLYHGSDGSLQSQVVDAATLEQDFLQMIQLPISVPFHQFSIPTFQTSINDAV